jgi:hypothetical protein
MIAPDESTAQAATATLQVPLWVWAAFIVGVAIAIVADLKLVHRTAHQIAMREALRMVAFWVALGMLVGAAPGPRWAPTRARSTWPATWSSSRCRSTTCSCSR